MKKLLLIIILLPVLSCNKILETEPRQSLDIEQAINLYSGLRGILLDTYDDIRWQWARNNMLVPEIMADNCEYMDQRGFYRSFFENNYGLHLYAWYYHFTIQANVVIAFADARRGEPGITEEDVDHLKGEAHVLRALLYFFMVNTYAYTPTAMVEARDKGGVPIISRPILTVGELTFPSRDPVDAVYDFIKEDLKAAIELLGNDRAAASQKGFVGKAAAQAFLSRVALYNGDWQEVIDYATAAIASDFATLSTHDRYADDWDAFVHPESFFTIHFQNDEIFFPNLQTIYNSVNVNDPFYSGYGEYVPSAAFLDLLSEHDVRREILQPGAFGREETTKFRSETSRRPDNINLIRLSEMYLNRAEAYARLGREAEAVQDLDLLRQRSLGEEFSPTTATGQELLEAILLERRLELAFEGQRWFDLKRLGADIDKRHLTGDFIEFANDPRILAPIPDNEIDLNPNMVQNEGY